jgi:hypothetical protein
VTRKDVSLPVTPRTAVKVARAAKAFDVDRFTSSRAPDPDAGATRYHPRLDDDSKETPDLDASPVCTIQVDVALIADELEDDTDLQAVRVRDSTRRAVLPVIDSPIDLPVVIGTVPAAEYPARTAKVVAARPWSLVSSGWAIRPAGLLRKCSGP